MNLFRIAALVASLFAGPALAQWQTPDHSVPLGRGAGKMGFGSVASAATDLPLVSNGPSADPSFRALPSTGLPVFTGDVPPAAGVKGVVPAPPSGSTVAGRILGAGGSWVDRKPLLKFVIPTEFAAKNIPNRTDIVPSTSTGTSGIGSVNMTKSVSEVWNEQVIQLGKQVQTISYVDPVNGTDNTTCSGVVSYANSCKTLQYAFGNSLAVNIVGIPTDVFDPFTWDASLTTQNVHRLTFTAPAIIQTAGAAYPTLNTQVYTLQSGSVGAGTSTWTATLGALAGLAAPQRVIFNNRFNANTGNYVRAPLYANCAALTTAANAAPNAVLGWAYEVGAKKFCMSYFGQDFNPNKGAAVALYLSSGDGDSRIAIASGAVLFVDTPYALTLMGASIQAYNNGSAYPTVLVEGRNVLRVVGAPGNGVHTQGGFHYFSGLSVEFSQFDGFNHDAPAGGALPESMVIIHNSKAFEAGDIQTFGTGLVANRNGISAHGGANIIVGGVTVGANWGPDVADGSVTGVTSLSWYTGLETQDAADATQGGIAMFGIGGDPTAVRKMWCDTCSTMQETFSLSADAIGGVAKYTNSFFNVPPNVTNSGTVSTYTRDAP